MSSSTSKISLRTLVDKYELGIIIPEIQRDYVMGAGGKGKYGRDKLKYLLESMKACAKSSKDFDFSCIITYCDNEKNSKLEIYDGQQRLTTLIFMYLHKCKEEEERLCMGENWFQFSGRPVANEIYSTMVNEQLNIQDIRVCDFTSYSIKNLLETISKPEYDAISSKFLLEKVKFDMVSIGSQNEIEQFFMDLNSGLQLKEFELYKAKLNHRIAQIKTEWKKHGSAHTYEECVNNWSFKLDNEWLDYFTPFASFEHTEEEYEIAFIKYCFQMVGIENNGIFAADFDVAKDNLGTVDIDTLDRVYHIMNNVTKLAFYYGNSYFLGKQLTEDDVKLFSKLFSILKYSWGDYGKESYRDICKNNYDKRGAYWALENNDYESMLYHVIANVLLSDSKENKKDLYKDILLWSFITTLDWKIDYQTEYLRIVKIILNHNVFENKKAWYECQGKGQYMYYCKYIVYGIPQYYGKHRKFEVQNGIAEDKYVQNLNDILALNKCIGSEEKKEQYELNRQCIINKLVENILAKENMINQKISDILFKEKTNASRNKKDFDILNQFANEVNGIIQLFDLSNIDKIEELKTELKNNYYETEVTVEWPMRGGRSSYPSRVTVLMLCLYDKLFEMQCKNDSNRIITAFNNSKISININEDIKKMFWIKKYSTVKIYKLKDRTTSSSTTYYKYDSHKGWADSWNVHKR